MELVKIISKRSMLLRGWSENRSQKAPETSQSMGKVNHKGKTNARWDSAPFDAHALLIGAAQVGAPHCRCHWSSGIGPVVLAVAQRNAHVVGESDARDEMEEGSAPSTQVFDVLHAKGLQTTLCHVAYTRYLRRELAITHADQMTTSASFYSIVSTRRRLETGLLDLKVQKNRAISRVKWLRKWM